MCTNPTLCLHFITIYEIQSLHVRLSSLYQRGGAVFQIRSTRTMSSTRVRKCSRPRSRSSPSTLSCLRAGSRGRERPRSCRGGTPAARATSKPSPAPPTRTKRAAPEVGARRPCRGGPGSSGGWTTSSPGTTACSGVNNFR